MAERNWTIFGIGLRDGRSRTYGSREYLGEGQYSQLSWSDSVGSVCQTEGESDGL